MHPQAQVMSDVEPVDNFHAAEDYHQSYLSRGGRFGRPQSAAKGAPLWPLTTTDITKNHDCCSQGAPIPSAVMAD